jgi:hypothetical protein
MFIKVSLAPTFITKRPRAMLINFNTVTRCSLENKKIEFYPGVKTGFGREEPSVIYYATHEAAEKAFHEFHKHLTKQTQAQKQERWDMASPDPLAVAALQDVPQLK